MFLRFFAIAVFLLIVGPATPVRADSFAKRFVVTPPQPTPPFTFSDAQGRTHDLKEFHGRYILLNLWASWCVPCIQEMPALNSLQDKVDYRDLNVIALNEDRNGIVAATAFYERHGLTRLPVYVDTTGHVPSIMHAHGLPTTFLINRDGMGIGYIEGEADWGSAETLAFLHTKIQ